MNSGTGCSTNAADNSIPITESDPKDLFDTYESTQSPPGGFHPYGMDMTNNDLFEPVSDNSDAGDITTGQIRPQSILPTHPLSGEMSSRSAKRTIPRQ
jgi:hypothetical protein